MINRKQVQACIAAIFLLATGFRASAQTSFKLTAKECADYAAKNNVQVKNALVDYLIQKETNRGITAAAFPQISANGTYTDNLKIATQSFPNFISAATYGVLTQEGVKNGNGTAIIAPSDYGTIAAAFGIKHIATGTINFSQLLFDGQVFIGLKARKTAENYSLKNVAVTEEAIRTNIYKIYYQLSVSQTQIDLLDANIARLEKLQHDTKEIYKNGFAEKLDVDKLSVQLTNLGTEKLKAVNQIEQGYLGLKFLMGMPVKDTLELTEKITDEKIKEEVLTDSSYKYTDRKDYQYLELVEKLNQLNVKRYQLSYLPTLSFNAAYAKSGQRQTFNFFNKGDWFTSSYFSFSLNVPIFDGFLKKSQVNTAKLTLQKTQNSIEDLKNSIDNDVAKARLGFKSAVASMDYQKQNMQLAEDVYNQTKKKYEIGTGSATEINTAETDLKEAQANYTNAMYDAIIAKIDYIKAIGKLE